MPFNCQCPECKGQKFIEIIDENNESVMIKTACYKNYQDREILKYLLDRAGIESLLLDYNLSKYVGEDKQDNLSKMTKIINDFDIKFYNLWLYFFSEKRGTQKTTLACYIAKELIKLNKECFIISLNNLINFLISSEMNKDFDEQTLARKILLKYTECDLLIIDDAFDERNTTIYTSGYQIPYIINFLKTRKRAIIFISNTKIEDINDKKFSTTIKGILLDKCKYTTLLFEDSYSEISNDFDISSIWD